MKKYLFYDIEFEKLFGGTLTSCEFGYVLTDKDFNILKIGEYLINPNLSNFELEQNGNENYLLRSNINDYLCKLDFSCYYNEIKRLFDQTDVAIGFATNTDANILNHDCKRYQLPCINHKFINIQRIYSYLHKNKHCPILKTALAVYGIKTSIFKFHNAQNDSMASLFLLKKMLLDTDMTIRKLVNRIPNLIESSSYGFINSINKKHQKQIFNYWFIRQVVLTFYLQITTT